ncbi:MAG: hypothetical protein ACOYBE_03760 [Blautia sp.]
MKNTCRRAVVYLLCLALLLSVPLGKMGGGLLTARGATLPISRIRADQILDARYQWQARFLTGKTKAREENCDNVYLEQFLKGPRGDWGSQATAGVASLPQGDGTYAEAEAPGCYYSNVGTIAEADGTLRVMDMKLSVTASYGGKNRYDYRTPSLTTTNPQMQPSGSTLSQVTYSWDQGMGRPCVSFLKNSIGLRIYCVDSVDVTITYYDHQTGCPLAVSGHGTLSDIDGQQAVGFPEGCHIRQVYLLEESAGHLSIGDGTVESGTESLPSDSRRGDLTYLFENTSSVTIHFSYQKALETMTANYEKALSQAGGDKQKLADKMKKIYYGSNGETLMPDYAGEEWVTSHAAFSYTSKVVGRFVEEPSKLLEKRIGDRSCAWEEAEAASRETPYWMKEDTPFDYLVRYSLRPSVLKEFTLIDTLPAGLLADNIHDVTISDKNGKEVTGSFDVSVEDGRKIVCRAAPEMMEEAYFSDHQIYTFRFTVSRDPGLIPPLEADNFTFLLPNQASLRIRYEIPTGETEEQTYHSNEVFAGGRIVPVLLVEKRASRYEWKTGETVDYTVKVTQTKQGAWAQGLVITDTDIPKELKLLDGFSVEEGKPTEHFVIAREGGNGWKCTGPLLKYDESVVIRFRCLATEEANGGEWQNYVCASSQNYVDEKTGEALPPVRAREEIWVNSPRLTVDKAAGHFEWQVGEEVEYTAVISNQTPGSLARNVVISDEALPEGVRLLGGAQGIRVDGLPETVGIPKRDEMPGINLDQKEPVEAQVRADENGWRMELNYLPGATVLTVHFCCKIEGDPSAAEPEGFQAPANGRRAVNKIAVSAENADPLEAEDTEDIYVNSACLYVDKTADHYEWQAGEEVLYTVTVENTYPGTIARNLEVHDLKLPEGLILAAGEDSLAVEDIPKTVSQPVKSTDGSEAWEEKEVFYQLESMGSGWRLTVSDLPSEVPIRITFRCLAEETANGREAVNAAAARADNGALVQDDARVYINTAVLSLEKSVINAYASGGEQEKEDGRLPEEFRVGEEVCYQVRVENIYPGTIARELIVEDSKLPSYLRLCALEKIQVEGVPSVIQNPVLITEDVPNQMNPQYYQETEEKEVVTELVEQEGGWRLRISDLPAHLPVVITYRCLVEEEANGKVIVNHAKAFAKNGKTVSDTEKIWVNTPKLAVTKHSDKEAYLLGDTQTYTIGVTQKARGCVARSVIIEDTILTEGVKLSKGSIVFVDQDHMVAEADMAIHEQAFAVSTGRNLVCPKGYFMWDGSEGKEYEMEAWNPLELERETELSVEYEAEVTDIQLAGQNVENMARAISMEGYPAQTEAKTQVLAPELRIEKESDKREYRLGEVAYFHIRVEQLREQAVARNVQISDTWDAPEMTLFEDTILAAKDGKKLESVQIRRTEDGFAVDTGTDLGDTGHLDLYYQLVAEDMRLVGQEIKNTSSAWAEYTAEVSQEAVIQVTDPDPALKIEKTSDQEQYQPGETGHYQVKVTQERPEAVARNVIITDEISSEGARILPETLVIKNHLGTVVSWAETEYFYGKGDDEVTGYTIYTGRDLAWQTYFTVEYDVAFSGGNTAREIQNTARATADRLSAPKQGSPKPAVLDGVEVTKSSDVPCGSLVKKGDRITYRLLVENTSREKSPNVLIKDTIPAHTNLTKTALEGEGAVRGRQMMIEGNPCIVFYLPKLEPGERREVGFQVEAGEMEKHDWIVNTAQVRLTKAKEKDVTEDTCRSGNFHYTNETVHFVDSLWVSAVRIVDILPKLSVTPANPTGSETPDAEGNKDGKVPGKGHDPIPSQELPENKSGYSSQGTAGVSTGDDTPVWWYAGAAAMGGTLAAIMLLWKKRRR